jgi:hypothetical protein
MRRVKYVLNRYVPADAETKGHWSQERGEGIFHCWGCYFEEFDGGVGNQTVAIVEADDGTLKEVLPRNLIFLERDWIEYEQAKSEAKAEIMRRILEG